MILSVLLSFITCFVKFTFNIHFVLFFFFKNLLRVFFIIFLTFLQLNFSFTTLYLFVLV